MADLSPPIVLDETPPAPDLIPLSPKDIFGTKAVGSLVSPQTREERLAEPGVSLNLKEGALSPWQRFEMAFHSSPEDRYRFLNSQFPGKVRTGPGGESIIRIADPVTGAPKDVSADPEKMELGDFAELASQVPEIAGSVLAEKGARALPLIGKLRRLFGVGRDIAAQTAGMETVGALKDIGVRNLEGVPTNIKEILERRAVGSAGDMIIGGMTIPISRLFRFRGIKSDEGLFQSPVIPSVVPFRGSKGSVQFDALEAQKYLKEKYGVQVDMTLGQLSGDPIVAGREKYLSKQIGSAEMFKNIEEKQAEQIGKLQRTMMGAEPLEPDVLGERLAREFTKRVQPAKEGVEAATAGLRSTAQADIEKAIGEMTLPERINSASFIGDMIRNRVVQLRDEAKNFATGLYNRFNELGGDQIKVSGADLASKAQKMLKELPPQFRATEEGTILKSPSTAFVPESSVLKRLNELASAGDGEFSFRDLQRMRNEVFDDLSKAEAVPGLGARYLSQIKNMLTDAMEKGVESIQNPEAKAALQKANEFYRNEVAKFEHKGINEMFATPFEGRWIGPAELAGKFMQGRAGLDRFNVLKGFLGENSLEFKALKRQIADELFQGSLNPGLDTLNAKAFIKDFSSFMRNNPELGQEVFGKGAKDIAENAFMLARAEGDKIPVEKLKSILAEGKLSSIGKLGDLISAEKAKDAAIQGSVLKALEKGTVDGLTTTGEDLVNRFFEKSGQRETEHLLSLLSERPALLQDVRTAYLQKMFQDESNGKVLSDILKDASVSKKSRAILGDELFDDLKKYGMLQKALEYPSSIADMAGAMSGQAWGDKALVQPLKTSPRVLRHLATALVLSNSLTRKWVGMMPPGDPGVVQAIFTSIPFTESVLNHFKDDTKAGDFMKEIKIATDDWLKGMMGMQASQQAQDVRWKQRVGQTVMPIKPLSPPTTKD